jgi:23S rRNA (adenine2503-C2)-methyltransferase
MTGTMGLVRNLGPGEIADQVHRANRRLVELGEGSPPRPLTNLVFMGMGEPLHNFDNLKVALNDILLAEDGPNFSHRHVTVSTSGLVPQMKRLGEETAVKLAVSLNATTDEQRATLMPIDKRYPLARLLAACRAFPMKQGRRITFEYVMLGGVNDRPEHAVLLARLARECRAFVNLIPLHPGGAQGFVPTPATEIARFARLVRQQGVEVAVRKSRGLDIAAACGQLRIEGLRRRTPRRADEDGNVQVA